MAMTEAMATVYDIWCGGLVPAADGSAAYAALVVESASGMDHASVSGCATPGTRLGAELRAAADGLARTPGGCVAVLHVSNEFIASFAALESDAEQVRRADADAWGRFLGEVRLREVRMVPFVPQGGMAARIGSMAAAAMA